MNTKFQLNQDIKKLSKQINKFIKVYAYKSAFLHYETKNLKHNDYLNITSVIFGYTDYNQYKLDNNKNKLSLKKLLKGFETFLKKLNPESKYYKEDIPQMVSTFSIYITLNEAEISKKNRSITTKITRRINKFKNSENLFYEAGEIKRIYDIVKKQYYQPIIIDFKSLLLFESKELEELNSLLKDYCYHRNALAIKKYIKDEKFNDRIGEKLYLLEDFLKEKFESKYIPFESLDFLAEQFKYFHAGCNDFWSRRAISKFKTFIAEKTVGKTALVKGFFNVIDEYEKNRYMDITRNRDGWWSSFDITLANSDEMSIHIYEDGRFVAYKKFRDLNIYMDLWNYKSTDLQWTIPIAERKGVRKERFKYFYPKYDDDKFIFKLSFNNSFAEVILNQYGILKENNKIDLSYKEIMEMLYEKYILELKLKKAIKQSNKDEEYEELKKEIGKKYKFLNQNYKN